LENNINNLIKDFFNHLQVQLDNLEVTNEEENIYNIKVQTPDSGILI